MKKEYILKGLTLGFVFLTLLFCSFMKRGEAAENLLGRWQCRGGDEIVSLEFQSENMLKIDGEPARYLRVPGVIRVEEDHGPVDYRYNMQGATLSILSPDGLMLECARIGSSMEKIANAPSGGHDDSAKAQTPSPQPMGPSNITTEELGNPQWGFAFRPPKGWKYRYTEEGVLLGHDTVPGMIVVFPHTAASLREVQTSMEEGLIEKGVTMNLVGELRKVGSNTFYGEYQGIWEGQEARGRGIGTFSPFGGGAMIVAVTTPEKYGPQLSGPAEQIASGMRYFKVEVSELMQNFSGYWWYYSGSSSISHENILNLAADGTYRDRREDSANVSNLDQYGNVTSQYLGNSQGRNRGRWTVRGNKFEGVISVTRADGSSFDLRYRVKPSNNQNFRAYYFNGKLYHWMTLEKLRMLGY